MPHLRWTPQPWESAPMDCWGQLERGSLRRGLNPGEVVQVAFGRHLARPEQGRGASEKTYLRQHSPCRHGSPKPAPEVSFPKR